MRQSGNVNIFKCDLLVFADDKSGDGLRVEDGRKTRDVYEPGPYISPLASSKMAFLTTDKLYQAVADAINREFEDIDNVDIQFEPSGQKKQIRKDKKDVKELRFRSRGNIIR